MILAALVLFSPAIFSQSIVGTWQLTKQSNCMTDELDPDNDEEELLLDMSAMANRDIPLTIEFKDNNTVEENMHTINSKKKTKYKSFLFKFDGDNLYILDKKSQTISVAYTIDRLSADSLIYSNASRPCETKVFVRLK
jgi:hypothetical protein